MHLKEIPCINKIKIPYHTIQFRRRQQCPGWGLLPYLGLFGICRQSRIKIEIEESEQFSKKLINCIVYCRVRKSAEHGPVRRGWGGGKQAPGPGIGRGFQGPNGISHPKRPKVPPQARCGFTLCPGFRMHTRMCQKGLNKLCSFESRTWWHNIQRG